MSEKIKRVNDYCLDIESVRNFSSKEGTVECTIYKQSTFLFCPDPRDPVAVKNLEEQLQIGKVTKEETLKVKPELLPACSKNCYFDKLKKIWIRLREIKKKEETVFTMLLTPVEDESVKEYTTQLVQKFLFEYTKSYKFENEDPVQQHCIRYNEIVWKEKPLSTDPHSDPCAKFMKHLESIWEL